MITEAHIRQPEGMTRKRVLLIHCARIGYRP